MLAIAVAHVIKRWMHTGMIKKEESKSMFCAEALRNNALINTLEKIMDLMKIMTLSFMYLHPGADLGFIKGGANSRY